MAYLEDFIETVKSGCPFLFLRVGVLFYFFLFFIYLLFINFIYYLVFIKYYGRGKSLGTDSARTTVWAIKDRSLSNNGVPLACLLLIHNRYRVQKIINRPALITLWGMTTWKIQNMRNLLENGPVKR
jgi:hypothetical protein